MRNGTHTQTLLVPTGTAEGPKRKRARASKAQALPQGPPRVTDDTSGSPDGGFADSPLVQVPSPPPPPPAAQTLAFAVECPAI